MGTHNRMVDLRNEVENQYQNLETQVGVKDQKVALVEQTDLAQLGLESNDDNIVEARKLFAQAKSSGNRSALSKASGLMDSVLPSALAFAESNPQLTSHNVLVAGLEEGVHAISKMASEVEEYNQSAKNFNTFTEMFPAVIVARMFGSSERNSLTSTVTSKLHTCLTAVRTWVALSSQSARSRHQDRGTQGRN